MENLQVADNQAFIRFSNTKARTIRPFMLEIAEYIDRRLLEEGDTIRNMTRLKAVNKDIKSKMNLLLTEWQEDVFDPTLGEAIQLELEFQHTIHAQVDMTLPAPAQVVAAAENVPLIIAYQGGSVDFGVFTKQWKPNEIKRVQGVINTGFAIGRSTADIVRQVVGTKSAKYSNGIVNSSRHNVETMVRTSLNHLSSQSKAVFGKENDDIIIGEKWSSTLDSATSSICRDNDGNIVLYVDNPKPQRPPAHPNCRSAFVFVYAPEFDFLDKGATRASNMDKAGQVSNKVKYYDLLKKQPAYFQDEALGKTKGRIFRNAGLTPSEFKEAVTDRFGKELTIKQMKLKDKRIAEYLG